MTDLPPPAPPVEALDPVAALRWERRVVVVFVPDADDPEWRRQQAIIADDAAGFADRDLTVFAVFPDGRVLQDGAPITASPDDFTRWRQGGGFEAVLIGKDGGAKLRRDTALEADSLFPLIDAMPMRRREMEERRR